MFRITKQPTCFGMLGAASLLLATGCQQHTSTPTASAPQPTAAAPVQIGGENVLTMTRKATSGGSNPEFLSVTLLPGRGMNMLQVTAAIPGKGEIPLLFSPSLADAAKVLTGEGKDAFGNASFSMGGAFLVPYPNRIIGEGSSDGKSVVTHWRGHTLTLPANFPSKNPRGRVVAIHGLITKDQVEELQTQTTADGQTVTGVIHAKDFGGHWLSDTDLNFHHRVDRWGRRDHDHGEECRQRSGAHVDWLASLFSYSEWGAFAGARPRSRRDDGPGEQLR